MTNEPTKEALVAEIARLQQRVTELERAEEELNKQNRLLRLVYKQVPYTVVVHEMRSDGNLYYIGVNAEAERLTGLPESEWIDKQPVEIFPPELYHGPIRERTIACLESGVTKEYEERLEFPVGEVWTNTLYIPMHDEEGNIEAMVVVAFDITESKKRQLAELQEREAVIEQQSSTLKELSTPLLLISDEVMVVPLIGAIDSSRAQRIMETLLIGIAERGMSVAIIDITGVPIVDTQIANILIQATQAVRLLGAQVILTGIRPEIAQTLVALDVDLSEIIVRGTLQAGIAYAIQPSKQRTNGVSPF